MHTAAHQHAAAWQRLIDAASAPRASLRILTVFHGAIIGFLLTPKATALDTHWLWIAPFVIAAFATAAASVALTVQLRIFAAVASIVAYASRALAFPLHRWADAPVNDPSLFPTIVWSLLIAYALTATRYSIRG